MERLADSASPFGNLVEPNLRARGVLFTGRSARDTRRADQFLAGEDRPFVWLVHIAKPGA
jgi:hypothetical protein